jgi:hypothetical protein
VAKSGKLKAIGIRFHYSFALITTFVGAKAVLGVDETGDVHPHIRFLM